MTLVFGHVRRALKHHALVDSKAWGCNGAAKHSWRMHDYFTARKQISFDTAIDNYSIGFDLSLYFSAFINDDGVLGKDLALENTTYLNSALK